ncbi:hypothetical protein [Nocardia sp. CS682]|uniref:hypothetical protein n=1 Tax=Nocardia sp. CS682 TaxID=1047172 RepID=UPI001074EA7D|nr:hypothetical protein [Nocardia sp. CS682]QBS44840.1 hypothetical protein DMB37_36960 [Nocardia sp. CS682]
MSDTADSHDPLTDLSTWTIERLQALVAVAGDRQLEAVRVVAQGHVYDFGEPSDLRRRWAKLSLWANGRMSGEGSAGRQRKAQNNFMLRTWVIDKLGPIAEDSDWSPEALATHTLFELSLTPHQARALGERWTELPIDQIRELRRHKNLTAHIERLAAHLQPSALRDQLLEWAQTRRYLP